MEITVKTRNNSIKVINDFELEVELEKVISTRNLDISEILFKLHRGDILGFNDTEFRKKNNIDNVSM